jgi:Tfp pilus assembly protein PilV
MKGVTAVLQLQAQNQQLTLEQHQIVQQIQTQQRFLQQFQLNGKFKQLSPFQHHLICIIYRDNNTTIRTSQLLTTARHPVAPSTATDDQFTVGPEAGGRR